MAPGAPPLVLASGSAARHALLKAAGLHFTVSPVALDEGIIKADCRRRSMTAGDAALALADAKASLASAPGGLVIGADQMLECDGVWFDKPVTPEALRTQLLALRGRQHTLSSAVACHRAGGPVWRHVATATLTMRMFSEVFLDHYLAAEGANARACVGGYRLEGPGIQLFSTIEGEHSVILGLPVLPLLDFLRGCGVLLG